MALELLKDEYEDNGMTIQFHPNTTYEICWGTSPIHTDSGLATVCSQTGILMELF